jgi:two-component system LytT family response regulator
MLRALIVDDIKEFRDAIKSILEKDDEITVVAEAECVAEAELKIKTYNPDLVFLDVEMPDGTGFDLLQKFETVFFKIIFVTGYQEFSIRAFKFSAVDYILKPIDREELLNAVIRAKQVIKRADADVKIQSLISTIKSKDTLPQKLVLKTSDYIFSVNIDDIIRCQAHMSYTTFFLTDGKEILISKTMKEYVELLSGHFFFRIHHSHLINMKYFDHLIKADGGMVVMKDKSRVPVSSRKKDELIALIEKL